VFYGFLVFDAIHKNNPGRQKFKNQVMSLMRQDGITYHGRVGHNALHYEMAKSGIWAYPTDFTEISCITAMKAQALGAVPVCTTLAALDETVKNGVKVDVDITMPEGQEEYFDALIKLMKDPEQQEHIRKGMTEWARKQFSWNNVADQWDELFRVNTQSAEKTYARRNKKNT
jgi:glycosyltransferase involved in cell wall biosynthesis